MIQAPQYCWGSAGANREPSLLQLQLIKPELVPTELHLKMTDTLDKATPDSLADGR